MAVIQEAYIQGISTRSVDNLMKAMGGTDVSKSQVSRLIIEIDERVNAFLNRPIEGEWPYLWIDATYLKEREGGRIVSTAVIVAVADLFRHLLYRDRIGRERSCGCHQHRGDRRRHHDGGGTGQGHHCASPCGRQRDRLCRAQQVGSMGPFSRF